MNVLRIWQYGFTEMVNNAIDHSGGTKVTVKVVILDFSGIDEIGQAFADEIFRVYSLQHPEVRIVPANTGPEVKRSIKRAKTGGAVLPFNRMDH